MWAVMDKMYSNINLHDSIFFYYILYNRTMFIKSSKRKLVVYEERGRSERELTTVLPVQGR